RYARLTTKLDRMGEERAAVGDEAQRDRAPAGAAPLRETAPTQARNTGRRTAGIAEKRAPASEARDAAASDLASLKAELAGLTSEHGALERELSRSESDHKAIDQVKAAPGYERALAAALGDDLLASVGEDGDRFWGSGHMISGVAASGSAPAGSETLLKHVKAPPQLH